MMMVQGQQQQVVGVCCALVAVRLARDQRGRFCCHPPSCNTGDCPVVRIVDRHTYI